MAKKLSENEVLNSLNIPDFRHLSKDKIMSFASMIQDMDPEVAKKALEQFPEFAKMSLEVMTEYKTVLEKSLDANTKSSNQVYQIYNEVIKSLRISVEKEGISFEEKKYYIEKMMQITEKAEKKDSENKQFNWKVIGAGSTIAVLLLSAGLAAIGGKGSLKLPKL